MHLLLIGLFLGVFLHDLTATAMLQDSAGVWRQAEALPPDAWPGLGLAPVVCIVLLPKIVLLLGYAMLCQAALRRLGTKSGAAWIRRLEQVTTLLPMTLLVLYMADLGAGALRWARVPFRHTVLVDELMVMFPTLLTLLVAWAIYYPLDRRMRESAMIGRIDRGLPIYTPPTRGQYLLAQLRHQVALLFVPLVMIAAWSESVTLLGPDGRGVFTATQAMLLVPAGALAVFSFAPLIIRHVWDTAPLPEGEIRRVMADLCRQHRVGVRELLVWRTYGVLVNAAVMGLVAPLRYILLSDALLDQMRRREVEAVMAHEIAHVRKHHMFWLLLVMVATLGLGEQAGQAALAAFDAALTRNGPVQLMGLDAQSLVRDERVAVTVVSAVSLLLALLVFGWVSRRAERQADVFAARHLAKTAAEPAHNDAGRVVFTPEASGTMIGALQRVAALNHIPTKRKMWRHGSIRWRQDHLRSLNGKPVDDADIDRVFARVKFAAVAAVVALGVLYSRQWTDKPEAILVETYQTIAAWL